MNHIILSINFANILSPPCYLNIGLTYMQKPKCSLKKSALKPLSIAASITMEKLHKNRSTTLRGEATAEQYFSAKGRKTSRKGSLGKMNLSETLNRSGGELQTQAHGPMKNLSATCPRRMLNLEFEMQEQRRLVAEASSSVERAEREFKTNSLKRLTFRKQLNRVLDETQGNQSPKAFLSSHRAKLSETAKPKQRIRLWV